MKHELTNAILIGVALGFGTLAALRHVGEPTAMEAEDNWYTTDIDYAELAAPRRLSAVPPGGSAHDVPPVPTVVPAPSSRATIKLRQHASLDIASLESITSSKPVLIMFTGPNCPKCATVRTRVLADPRVAATLNRSVEFVMVDGEAHQELVKQFGVTVYPTFVLAWPGEHRAEKFSPQVEPDEFLADLGFLTRRERDP